MTDYQKQSPMQAIEVNNIKKSYENKYALGQPDSKEGFHFRYLKVNCSVS